MLGEDIRPGWISLSDCLGRQVWKTRGQDYLFLQFFRRKKEDRLGS
jgi:hypothetical protein